MDPPVKIIENFLSPEDCTYLIKTYNEKVFKSRVVLVHDGKGTSGTDSSRTSSTFFIPNSDPIIRNIRTKVSTLLDVDVRNIEGIQFLRYLKGERYLWHHDYLKAADITNQRTDTFIVYLNDLEEADGGATAFFHYKMKVCPKEGTAAWFKNCNADGTLIRESLHAGVEIITDKIKYALNVWVLLKPL
jgi:prolyl 4-hydroxylase